MGILRTTIAVTGWGSLAAASTFVGFTRKSKVYPIAPTDYIFGSSIYTRYNPSNAPVTHDICIRREPLSHVKPELLEKEGRLTEAFCAGVWSGIGYAYQRRYLEKKYRADSSMQDQLWDRKVLASSTYEPGTKITDHFEVVAKTPHSIIVRCGDSPRNQEPRASDGLFEMSTEVKQDDGVVEFGLKSLFYNSLNGHETPDNAPMPAYAQWLHQLYDKVLMESAVRGLTR